MQKLPLSWIIMMIGAVMFVISVVVFIMDPNQGYIMYLFPFGLVFIIFGLIFSFYERSRHPQVKPNAGFRMAGGVLTALVVPAILVVLGFLGYAFFAFRNWH